MLERPTAELVGPFTATSYRVLVPAGSFDLRIGKEHPDFDRFLAAAGVCEWSVITAHNPGASLLAAEENARRQESLGRHFHAQGLAVFPCEAIADFGDWPVEEGFLALGLSAAAARALGTAYGQAAVVCGRRGERACLVWCVAQVSSDDSPKNE